MTTVDQAPDILSPEFALDPYAAYRVFLDRFPLVWHDAMQSYIVSSYEDLETVFQNHQAFTTENYDWQIAPVHGPTMLEKSGHDHAVRRRLVSPAFRGKALEETFGPVIQSNARALVDTFRHSGEVDLVADFADRFPVDVIVDMLGLDKSNYPRFRRWYQAIIAYLGNLSQDPDVAAEGERTRDEFAAYMLPIIRQRRDNLGDDLLSRLCTAEVDGTALTDEEIKAFCSLLLAAGGETTAKAIPSMMANLAQHPEQLDAVRRDRELIARAFAETLRYTPPVQMIMRHAVADVPLSGGTIQAGNTVTCLIGAANRDPRRYNNPDTFDIFRDDLDTTTAFTAAANHLAFALGPHFCVGALLAKKEVEEGVNQLLDAMSDLRIRPGRTPVEQGVFTRGLVELPLEFSAAQR